MIVYIYMIITKKQLKIWATFDPSLLCIVSFICPFSVNIVSHSCLYCKYFSTVSLRISQVLSYLNACTELYPLITVDARYAFFVSPCVADNFTFVFWEIFLHTWLFDRCVGGCNLKTVSHNILLTFIMSIGLSSPETVKTEGDVHGEDKMFGSLVYNLQWVANHL